MTLWPITTALAERRAELGLTVEALAERAGVTDRTVRRALGGYTQDLTTLSALARAMGLRVRVGLEEAT